MSQLRRATDSSFLADHVVDNFATDMSAENEAFIATPLLDNSDDISSAVLDYADRKARLRGLIEKMVRVAPAWDGEPVTVTSEAVQTADQFLVALPTNRELPKVAPDGDGGLLLVWEPPHGNCIVTVQPEMLHMVDQPGTRQVAHIDNQPFRGKRIPISILHAIPFR